MLLHPVILDLRPSYMEGGDEAVSLLLLPLGGGRWTLLNQIVEEVGHVTTEPVTVVSSFPVTAGYVDSVQEAEPRRPPQNGGVTDSEPTGDQGI